MQRTIKNININQFSMMFVSYYPYTLLKSNLCVYGHSKAFTLTELWYDIRYLC